MRAQTGRPPEPSAGLPTVDSRSVHERVYDEIRIGLAKGVFAEGQTLSTRSLAAAFGTSEMPVREAIRRLVAEKFIVQLSNRTFQVPQLDPREFADVISVRLMLERRAAADCAAHAKAADVAVLRALNAELGRAIAARELRNVLKTNEEFHFAVYACARSPTLTEMIQTLWSRSGPYLASVIALDEDLEVFSRAVEMHDRVIQAIERGDGAEAADALEADVTCAVEWYHAHRAG